MTDRPCLLDYSFHTVPYPVKSSPQAGGPLVARMIITVSNGSRRAIECRNIRVNLELGAMAQHLTDLGDSIRPFVTPFGKWEVVYDEDGHFTFTPRRCADGLMTTDGLTFCLDHIYVNQQPGTYRVEVVECSRTTRLDHCAKDHEKEHDCQDRRSVYELAKFPRFLVGNG